VKRYKAEAPVCTVSLSANEHLLACGTELDENHDAKILFWYRLFERL
jgi:hypothetical protein